MLEILEAGDTILMKLRRLNFDAELAKLLAEREARFESVKQSAPPGIRAILQEQDRSIREALSALLVA